MKCGGCDWTLAEHLVRYKDWRGEPLCQNCYIQAGGIVEVRYHSKYESKQIRCYKEVNPKGI